MYDTPNIRDSGVLAFREVTAKPLSDVIKTVFFLYGYSTTEETSEEWSAEVFKRLWQQGLKAKFLGVTWEGDVSQIETSQIPGVNANVTPNYYVNVRNAFSAAPLLANYVYHIPHTEFSIMAHSLGNMLASNAISLVGMRPRCYFMMNAAVPVEAYNEDAPENERMIPENWQAYRADLRANRWHTHFKADDARSTLHWRGIFSNFKPLAQAHGMRIVNFYSLTEDILSNPPSEGDAGTGNVWVMQEQLKGTWPATLLNPLAPWRWCEGGWGINSTYQLNPLWTTDRINQELVEDAIATDPLFTPFSNTNLHCSTNETVQLMIEDRRFLLASAIPATTGAAGANKLDLNAKPWIDDVEFKEVQDNFIGEWWHSTFQRQSMIYSWKIYARMIDTLSQSSNGGTE